MSDNVYSLTWLIISLFILASNFKCLNSEHQQFHFFHIYIRPCEKNGIIGVLNLRILKFDASMIYAFIEIFQTPDVIQVQACKFPKDE